MDSPKLPFFSLSSWRIDLIERAVF